MDCLEDFLIQSYSLMFVKNSLAYYAASRFESHKGLLFVMSGIEAKNYEKAVEIIKEQMLAMQNGDFLKKKCIKRKVSFKIKY